MRSLRSAVRAALNDELDKPGSNNPHFNYFNHFNYFPIFAL
jgi:hypothetical protein